MILVVGVDVKGTEEHFGNARSVRIVTTFTRIEGTHSGHFFVG